ncbi:MAG: magnesium transporter [Candidatus Goldiibacteriota bacterium]
MLKELLSPELHALIQEKDWRGIKEVLCEWPAPDIADFLKSLDNKDSFILFRLLSRSLAAEVFSELDSESQARLLNEIGDENVLKLVLELSADDRTELFDELPGDITQRLISRLPAEIRKESLKLLGYPDYSVGRLMTPDYISIISTWTAKYAIGHIRRNAKKAETINIVYVTDKKNRLVDEISLSSLVVARPSVRVSELMDEKVISITASEHREEAAKIMRRYDLLVLPVVDSENVLLGVVTVDDVMDVMEEAVNEDMQKAASVVPFESRYSSMDFFTLFKKRIVWLMLLGLAGILSGSVISFFEETLGSFVMLAFFIPTLIGTGGNTAIQSSTLIIRAIAVEDITPGRWFMVMKKELLVGIWLGVILSLVLFAVSYVWVKDIKISFVIAFSVVFIALWANIIGSMLPLLLTKMKLDPAVVSSPLLTTILDVTGLLIYFSIAGTVLSVI